MSNWKRNSRKLDSELMTQGRRSDFLRLIHSEVPADESVHVQFEPSSAQTQATFLPSRDPATLIFFSWGNASADDLVDILELSEPKIIFDLRLVPRFDLGALTRRRFFELIRQHNCQYVDLLGQLRISRIDDALLNPQLIASRIAQFMSALDVPNYGPFAFLFDGKLINQQYLSQLARSLPSGTGDPWKIYLAVDRNESDRVHPAQLEGPAAAVIGTATSVRRPLFISHATPDDNAFVVWLASKLMSAGYQVWSDITDLQGGDVFWGSIEEVIRRQAAKVLFVHSAHAAVKAGVRKEVYLALRVAERSGLQRFVVPLRMDETPFDETLIELIDIQAIDCSRDWLDGLQSLIALLERDGVARISSFKTDQASRLISNFARAKSAIVRSPELLISNWLPITRAPPRINFFSCSGLATDQLPTLASRLPVPAFAFMTHIVTTASSEQFEEHLATAGLPEVRLTTRASLSWDDFLSCRYGDLPSWRKGEAKANAFNLLRQAWELHATARRACRASLANEKSFWYFAHGHLEKDEVRFLDHAGKNVRRKLVGYSAKRQVFWHFGAQVRATADDAGFHLVLTPHVTFSRNGRDPLDSASYLHSLRRSFCRSWWNDRWRDLLQGFAIAFSDGEGTIHIEVGADSPMEVASAFRRFACPVALANAELVVSSETDLIDDVWEPDEDEMESAIEIDTDVSAT
jgi:hypothetical protein